MQGEQCRCGRRKNGDVKGIEPSDGRACNAFTAPQEPQQKRSDNRDAADDLGADLRREKRKFVQGKRYPLKPNPRTTTNKPTPLIQVASRGRLYAHGKFVLSGHEPSLNFESCASSRRQDEY